MKHTRTTIIIVEDEEHISETLGYLFEDLGWDFFSFISGEGALKFLEKKGAEVAIVDLRLPGMSGIEFIKKAHRLHPPLKFIIFTGTYEDEALKELEEIPGISPRIFQKPVKNLEEFVEEIQKMVYPKD